MDNPYLSTAFILLVAALLGLVRIFLSHGRVEHLLSLQLLGTSSVAIVLLLAEGLDLSGLRDLALVLGLLASILAMAFVRFGLLASSRESDEEQSP
jgi:multicomponent Na+:H+ antiporter subunit F